MPIGSTVVFNSGDLILSTVSSSGDTFQENKIAAATSSIILFDSNALISSQSLISTTVGTASYVSGSNIIVSNLTASNISASGTSSFGYVGIGTNNPIYKLDVQPTSSTVRFGQALVGAFPAGPSIFAFFGHTGLDNVNTAANYAVLQSSTGDSFFNASSGRDIYFRIGNADKMFLSSSGQFGIGTTSPSAILQINGSGNDSIVFDANTQAFFGANARLPGRIIVGATSTAYPKIMYNAIPSASANRWNYLSGDTAWAIDMGGANAMSFQYVGVGTANNSFTSWNTIMTLVSGSGNVGISTTSPANKLSIIGAVNIGSSGYNTAAPANGLIVEGNVGIGTTSPSQKLHVIGDALIASSATAGNLYFGDTFLYVRRDNSYDLSLVQAADSNSALYLASAGSVYVNIDSNNNDTDKAFIVQNNALKAGTELFRVSETGNVGIGTTNPATNLSVIGEIYASSRVISDRYASVTNGNNNSILFSSNTTSFINNGGTSLYINSSGGVGIGTNNPNYAFDVYTNGSADALMSIRTSGSANARIYLDAANGDLTGGDYCYLGQDKSTLNFVINTGVSAGNIYLQPKEGTNNGILFVSGSTRFGLVSTQNHQFTGSVNISGSLNATASWATNALTASSLVAANSYTITNLTASNISASGTSSFGMVGIGTTTTPLKLNVSGSIYMAGGNGSAISWASDISSQFLKYDSVIDGMILSSWDNTTFYTQQIERVRINSVGNIGIGTSNPTGSLHVKNSVANIPILNLAGGIGEDVSDLYVLNSYNTGSGVGFSAKVIGVNISSSLTAGNIPVQRSVWSGVTSATAIVLGADGPQNNAFQIWTTNNDTSGSLLTQKFSVSSLGEVGILSNNSGQYAYQYIGRTASEFELGVVGSVGQFFTGTVAGDAVIKQNSTGKLHLGYGSAAPSITIDSSNNVGIGTNSPTGKLQLGADYADDGYGGYDIYIKSTNVGTLSNYDPRIQNTSIFSLLITDSSSTTTGPDKVGIVLHNNNATAGAFSPMLLFTKKESGSTPYKATMAGIYARSPLGTGNSDSWIDGELIFATAGATSEGIKQRMVIDKEGNVGIGTSSPAYKLDLNVTSNSDAFSIKNSGQSRFILTGDAIMNWGASAGNGFLSWDTGIAKVGGLSGNVLTLSSNGTEKARIDLNGNVGIGTTNPTAQLHICLDTSLFPAKNVARIVNLGYSGITGAQNWTLRGAYQYGGGIAVNADGGDLDLIKSLDANTILATKTDGTVLGNVGIGTTNPVNRLDVVGNISCSVITASNFFGTSSWTTNALTASYLVPTNNYQVTNLTASNISASGTIRATNLIETSTIAAKYNIFPLENQLDKISKLNPVSFNYKLNDQPSIGLIAEEVGKIYPEFTSETNDAIAYGKMVSVLIQSVKELKTIVENQQQQINNLLNK